MPLNRLFHASSRLAFQRAAYPSLLVQCRQYSKVVDEEIAKEQEKSIEALHKRFELQLKEKIEKREQENYIEELHKRFEMQMKQMKELEKAPETAKSSVSEPEHSSKKELDQKIQTDLDKQIEELHKLFELQRKELEEKIKPQKAPSVAPDSIAASVEEKAIEREKAEAGSTRTRNIFQNIDLLVCDMAGTVVAEGGIVYDTLQRVMVADGLKVSNDDMARWHGAKKEAVIEYFASKQGTPEKHLDERIIRISDSFVKAIQDAYFSDHSSVKLIDPSLEVFLTNLRISGVKVALNTGYPPDIQEGLVKKFRFDRLVDGYISAYQVKEGRPYPYMIYQLMERLGIEDVRRVAKAGDSVRDIEEGLNAGCGLVIGVLSGADTAEALVAAGADIIVQNLTELPFPAKTEVPQSYRLPDLS